MGANEVFEPALVGKRIFLESCQVAVALVLLSTCPSKDCRTNYNLWCEVNRLRVLPRLKNCSCQVPSASLPC